MSKDKTKKENIEVLMKQIEKIIEILETGEIDLDESIRKYEEGMNLINKCKKILKESKLKVEILKKKDDKLEEEINKEAENNNDEWEEKIDIQEKEEEEENNDDDEIEKLF